METGPPANRGLVTLKTTFPAASEVPQKIKESFSKMETDRVDVRSQVMVTWTQNELEGMMFQLGWYEREFQWRNEDK